MVTLLTGGCGFTRLTQGKSPVVVVGDFIAFLDVSGITEEGHEDSRLARNVGAGVPGITAVGKQGLIGDTVHQLYPFLFSRVSGLGALQ